MSSRPNCDSKLSDNNLIDSSCVHDMIVSILQPHYIQEVESVISKRTFYRKLLNICQLLSEVFVCISIILSFSCSMYDYKLMSYLAGCAGIVGEILNRLSVFTGRMQLSSTARLNSVLTTLGVHGSFLASPEDSATNRFAPALKSTIVHVP